MNMREDGFFVLRTPLLPFSDALAWGDLLSSTTLWNQQADRRLLEAAWTNDVALLRLRLSDITQRPLIRRALAVASPSLHQALLVWREAPDSKKGLQAERALTKYFMRMTGRPTPFGLFSGCSIGTTLPDAPTQILLAPETEYRTSTRLDFDFITSVTTALRNDLAARDHLRYSLNSSLHRSGHHWHYTECRSSGTQLSYHLAQLENDTHLEAIVAAIRDSQLTLNELVLLLATAADDFAGFSPDEIRMYLHLLIDSDVITPCIMPRITGGGTLQGLISDLREIPYAKRLHDTLVSVDQALTELDQRPLTVEAHEYSSIVRTLERLPGTLNPERPFHIDMFKPVAIANIGRGVIKEVNHALRVLGCFAVAREKPHLTSFRESFMNRYETAWVPLAEALDPELGIGYSDSPSSQDSPLLTDFRLAHETLKETKCELTPLQAFLIQKLIESAAAGNTEIDIADCELPQNNAFQEVLPECFSVFVTLISDSDDTLQKGDFELLYKGGQGPSNVRSVARFCSSAPGLKDLVDESLREEEARDPEAVFAEIVYHPEGRAGNVVCRPLLREYEIPISGRSGAPPERQLHINDLLVGVREGRVVLYSLSLKRRIEPRLSSAHNYALPGLSSIYRFLCDLQNQCGVHVPYFTWGALSRLKNLPRVRASRVILARAQWTLQYSDLSTSDALNRFEGFVRFKQLQADLGLPRWVLLAEQDWTLPLDLDNPLCVDSLIQHLKRSQETILLEMLPGRSNQSVRGPEGSYEHELVIPLIKERKQATAASGSIKATASMSVARSERLIPPGGMWQYLKIYIGWSLLEEVLTQELGPLMTTLCDAGLIKDWFFVRYADPQPHLRLRFRATTAEAVSTVTEASKRLLALNKAWKIQWDTYHREIERYGGIEAIASAEEIFCADSEASLRILQSLDPEDADMRWRSALLGLDKWLMDCKLSIVERVDFANRMRHYFAKEVGATDRQKRLIGDQYRRQRASVEALLESKVELVHPRYASVFSAYQVRSLRVRSAVRHLRLLNISGKLDIPFTDIVASHVHMNLNRMMRTEPRAHEFVLYEYSYRLSNSRFARSKRPKG